MMSALGHLPATRCDRLWGMHHSTIPYSLGCLCQRSATCRHQPRDSFPLSPPRLVSTAPPHAPTCEHHTLVSVHPLVWRPRNKSGARPPASAHVPLPVRRHQLAAARREGEVRDGGEVAELEQRRRRRASHIEGKHFSKLVRPEAEERGFAARRERREGDAPNLLVVRPRADRRGRGIHSDVPGSHCLVVTAGEEHAAAPAEAHAAHYAGRGERARRQRLLGGKEL
mmetsp:Transcript_10115/g.33821  ORF Transcript_10115/g.33821 Transcript_10115/m.33821 type:complete len:226 (-) Transcript_10115:176-853(-)